LTERDPWIFYERGKLGFVILTSDKLFMKSFPHMAAIALGKTTVLFFSKNNWRSELRGNAFIEAQSRVMHALKKQKENFLACIGFGGTFSIVNRNPKPMRKLCDPRDWESYQRVCESEGIIAETPKDSGETES
jgi:hypothetical protein